MQTFLRIRSEYFEVDSSKYRLGITDVTLIPSLINQTSKKFVILLEMSAMDPCYTRRRGVFKSIGVPVYIDSHALDLPYPRFEVIVGDDDFLVKNFVAVINTLPQQRQNTMLLSPNGYVFESGELRVCNGRPDLVEAIQIVDDAPLSDSVGIEVSKYPGWIHVRHGMNLTFGKKTSGPVVSGLKWPGWNPRVVATYCGVSVKTATAQGCELHPTRSKSVVFASHSGKKRRR